MNIKERYLTQVKNTREYSEGILAAFQTPEQWIHQVHPGTNHALWFVGHMAFADNFFTSVLAPEMAEEESEQVLKLFGLGSEPSNNIDDYPPPAEVIDLMRRRRERLLEAMESITEEDFTKPTPEGTPDFLTDLGSVYGTVIWHEGLHSGQLSMVRRSLGNAPLFEAPEATEASA